MLFKEIVDARTDGRTDDGRSQKLTLCSGELKRAENKFEKIGVEDAFTVGLRITVIDNI